MSSFLRGDLDRIASRPANAQIIDRLTRRSRKGGPTAADTVAEIRRTRDASWSSAIASAMVDALVDGPVDPDLLALMADEELHAPALLDHEVASALRGHALGGKLTAEQVDDAVDDFSALTIERYPPSLMVRDVLDLAHDLTAYDAAYVVLARALDAPPITADAKLSGARRLGIDLRVLRGVT